MTGLMRKLHFLCRYVGGGLLAFAEMQRRQCAFSFIMEKCPKFYTSAYKVKSTPILQSERFCKSW